MVGIVTRPQLASHDGHTLCDVAEDRPAFVWNIGAKAVKEAIVVDSLMAGDQIFVFLEFNLTEMLPTTKLKCVFSG